MIIKDITDITWDQATENWDTFYADQYYSQYILETYGIEVPPPYGILWDHALILTIELGGKPGDDQYLHKTKKKKVKLIFMMEDRQSVFDKDAFIKVHGAEAYATFTKVSAVFSVKVTSK